MKTPDEIKKGLPFCAGGAPCIECHYDGRDFPQCIARLHDDALAYIHQLERERNAMLASMRQDPHCCYHCNGIACTTGRAKGDSSCFEWRGVEEDDHAQND